MALIILIIGLFAGFLTALAFLPQVIQILKTKSVKDLSLGTFILQGTANLIWAVYGIIIKEIPLILWNTLTAILVLAIISLILKYRESKVNIAAGITIPAALLVSCALAIVYKIEWSGYVATAFGLVTFMPQTIKTWRTKQTKDISLIMYVVFWLGVALWLTYGILIQKSPVIIVNVVVLSLTSIILFLKVKHG